MANSPETEDFFNAHQEEICRICEDEIIEGPSMTSTFLCEGRFCNQALELFLEEYDPGGE